MTKARIWILFAVYVFVQAASLAGPAHAYTAGEFDSYVFSLSWQPTFCATKPDKQECTTQTADRYDAKNLVLHGLWPNKDDDAQHRYGYCGVSNSVKKLDKASTWCDMPELNLSDGTKGSLSTYMPGYASCLERHEWYKHGTCSGLGADDYFALGSGLVEKAGRTGFNRYISDHVGSTVSSADLVAEFEKDFGEGSSAYMTLSCVKAQGVSMLSEVRMYLSPQISAGQSLKDLLVSPSSPDRGNCPDNILIVSVRANATSVSDVVTTSSGPKPLLSKGHPVDWWFVFKFNASSFQGCGGDAQRDCLFGGTVQNYPGKYSQQYLYASSESSTLQKGAGCVGDTLQDPVGATFDQVYNGSFFYAIWNDQFYGDPSIAGCSNSCSSPWGHSKGMVAWDKDGNGFVMQVSTPSWPASGSNHSPRSDGNTLGCVTDNNVKVNQHFFALRLNKDDLIQVLKALGNASVVTDTSNAQIVNNGGPTDVQEAVGALGTKSGSTSYTNVKLSSGVTLISKPSALHVPAWQFVSASLNKLPLRTATWWANPKINSTNNDTAIDCWSQNLGRPGAVQVALSGSWDGTSFSLKGGPQLDSNHAKFGVSLDKSQPYAIFGDLNQQGALSGNCGSSQNGRGGTFYVVKDQGLFDSITSLISGDTAPVAP